MAAASPASGGATARMTAGTGPMRRPVQVGSPGAAHGRPGRGPTPLVTRGQLSEFCPFLSWNTRGSGAAPPTVCRCRRDPGLAVTGVACRPAAWVSPQLSEFPTSPEPAGAMCPSGLDPRFHRLPGLRAMCLVPQCHIVPRGPGPRCSREARRWSTCCPFCFWFSCL